MLEEFMNVMTDNSVDTIEDELKKAELNNLIDGLEMFSNDPKMLTNAYTDILCSDNVVYLLTRISQNGILKEHFPELYEKNEFGESVINCQQNSPYHRYGVFRHILYTIEYVGKDNLNYSKQELKILKWTMFLHDIGKPFAKTTNTEGKDSFAGHDDISVELATTILDRFYFTDDEKNKILNLIKYHDRYLNEGELTYDNLSFLAEELENKKDLFDMLIEVKAADNRAKSIAVYNKFLSILPKYIEFKNEYFANVENDENIEDDLDEMLITEQIGDEELIVETKPTVKKTVKSKKSSTISKEEFEVAYQNILHEIDLIYNYIPVVNLREKNIYGYNIQPDMAGDIDIKQVISMSKEEGKFEKINQLLLLNSMEQGVKEKSNKTEVLIVKIDMQSFAKYNNKTRVYDILDKDNVLILFENYDYSNVTDINEMCKEIKKRRGITGLADFQNSTFTMKELSKLEIDIIEYKYDTKNIDSIKELNQYCLTNAQKLWVSDVNSKKSIEELEKINAEIISGEAVLRYTDSLRDMEYNVDSIVK